MQMHWEWVSACCTTQELCILDNLVYKDLAYFLIQNNSFTLQGAASGRYSSDGIYI